MTLRALAAAGALASVCFMTSGPQPVAAGRPPAAGRAKLDAEGERWVAATLEKMTLDDKVGQLLVSSFGSEYMSTDSPEFEALARVVHDQKIGGFHVFGGTEAGPDGLLAG